jgi:hypothetical protein
MKMVALAFMTCLWQTLIFQATGCFFLVRIFVFFGCDINATDDNGETPLFHIARWPASSMRTEDVMRLLPKATKLLPKMGALADKRNKLRQTPAAVIRACAQHATTILKQMALCCSRYISLSCLAAAALRSYGIVYEANEGKEPTIPVNLVDFVDMH